MTDNILILGAGFSHDAGIPLLGSFVERMWDYAKREKAADKSLTNEQLELLNKALEIRQELDGYHGRATFDDWNIEDILSILSFNVLGGTQTDKNKLANFVKAIALTIELSSTVKHPGIFPRLSKSVKEKHTGSGPGAYRTFWRDLLTWTKNGNGLPAIITFNYDLVLERSLHQLLCGTSFQQPPSETLSINYDYRYAPESIFKLKRTTWSQMSGNPQSGIMMEEVSSPEVNHHIQIELFKLHGSLNFPRSKKELDKDGHSLCASLNHPFLLPPLTNKHLDTQGNSIWKGALNRLREAKNIVIIGYSLPVTDTYMQYFLKAGLGPNTDINRITVFDPILFEDGDGAADMKNRYGDCFSEQLRNRIVFEPSIPNNLDSKYSGTFHHYLRLFSQDPSRIYF